MFDFQTFYGFTEHPFAPAPDPKYFFASEGHREALAALQYGIANRKGFILLLAEAGLGKSMLIHQFKSKTDPNVRTIYFPQVQMPFLQMLRDMLVQLNLKPEFETKGSMIHCLYYHLIECLGRRENVVLILDGAEQSRLDLLEEVRLLANLETGSSKLLQIVMSGKPELGKKLHSDIVRQIEQRIVIHSRIPPLTVEESGQYIKHRIKTAGGSPAIFTDQALNVICKAARGVPRTLNMLCSNALILGYRLSEKNISAATAAAIRREKDFLSEKRAKTLASRIKTRFVRRILVSLAVMMLLGLIVFYGRAPLQLLSGSPETKLNVAPVAAKPGTSVPKVPQAAVIHTNLAPKAPTADKSAAEAQRIPAAGPAAEKVEHQIRVKKTVEVSTGTSLSLLALQNYRMVNETLMDHILKLNPDITNPNLLLPQQKIKIPEITESLLITKQATQLYKVHLRTFSNLQHAERYKRMASSWARDLDISPWKISSKETWYRVMTGSFSSRDEALKAVSEMTQKGFSLTPAKDEKF